MWSSSILELFWELLLGLDPMPPCTAALQCTQSSYTLRRSCPLHQQAHVIHSETLTSDKKETGTCIWGQGALFFSKSSPSDCLNCALLQLLESQERCREKRSLDFHEALAAVLEDITIIIHELLFYYSCATKRPACVLWRCFWLKNWI